MRTLIIDRLKVIIGRQEISKEEKEKILRKLIEGYSIAFYDVYTIPMKYAKKHDTEIHFIDSMKIQMDMIKNHFINILKYGTPEEFDNMLKNEARELLLSIDKEALEELNELIK